MSKQKTKILFDAGPLVNGSKTGVGKTTEGLVLALAKNNPDTVELIGHYFDFFHKKKNVELPILPNLRYKRTVLIPGKILNMLRRLGVWIPFEFLVKEKGDFHLFPGFIGWPSLFKTPSSPFVHDITYIDFPQYVNGPAKFDLKTLMPKTLSRSAFVIVNSESSKKGLLREYDLKNKTVLVEHIPPVGVMPLDSNEAKKRIKKFGITKPYLLFFGTLEPRKNLVGLIKAFEILSVSNFDYTLVIAGGKGWHDDEILKAIKTLNKKTGSVIQTGYVSDEDRAALFMEASVFINPSHYEGFGMQLLEAMYYQTPTVASSIDAHIEVAQNFALYCDTSPEDIAKKISILLKDSELQKKMIAKGSVRLCDFSWENVAKDVMSQIKKTLD